MSLLEISANIIMVAAVFLAAKNHWVTWPLGVIACVLFGVLFYRSQLYADVTLQIFFIVTNLAGWYMWQRPNAKGNIRPITRVSTKTVGLVMIPLAIISALAYGTLLAKTTDAHLPIMDSLVLTFSIAAQFLLMARKLETWIFWIIVNVIAVPLFASKGLYLTSFVYALFLANAVYGFMNWRSEYKQTHV